MTKPKYQMEIERTIVDDLGLKLYDKVSAVVAELVANSYDADAENVIVQLPFGKALAKKTKTKIIQSGHAIEVTDDGHGLTPEEAQKFYLKIGKHRRDDEEQGNLSREKKRPVMGRKGLGKLAPFGVCKTIEVRSAGGKKTEKGYKVCHFKLDYDEIIKNDKKQQQYQPTVLTDDEKWDKTRGTTIKLTNFLTKTVPDRDTFGRQMSYRFGSGAKDFKIKILDTKEKPEADINIENVNIPTMDGTKITVNNRPVILEDGKKLPVKGWIGMSKQPYKNEEFAGVRIYVRGKIASITKDFGQPSGFQGEFVARSYLVGQIEVDWLDDEEDLIQTHRQDILWSSDLGQALSAWGREIVKEVAKKGREPRREKARKMFIEYSNFEKAAEKRFSKYKDPELISTALDLANRIGGFASEEELEDKSYVENLSEIILSVTPHKLLVDTFKRIQELAIDGKIEVSEVINLLRTSKIAQLASYGQVVEEKLNTIDLLQKTIFADGAKESDFQKLLESAPWIINAEWEPITNNQSLKNFRSMFGSWYKKKYGTNLVMTTEIENPDKQPDFILLHLENALQIVEIKPPKHTFDDTDWKRMIKYPDAVEKYMDENPHFHEDFPNGIITTLVADKKKLSYTEDIAFSSLQKEKKLIHKTWTQLLTDTKKANESFLKARDSLNGF